MADSAAVNQYLQSRGAKMSGENATRVRNHFASNPDLLERRAAGLPGGLDDNSGTLDGLLDKQLQESMPVVAQAVQGEAPVKQVPAPSNQRPYAKQPQMPASYPAPAEANGNPLQQSGRQPNGGGDPAAVGLPSEDPALSASGPQGDIGTWLKALLGLSAGVPAAANMRGQMSVAPPGALPPPQGRITSQVGPNMESVGNEMETINQRNQAAGTERKAVLQNEIDAENDDMMRRTMTDAAKRKQQAGADATVNAAKRFFRR